MIHMYVSSDIKRHLFHHQAYEVIMIYEEHL